MNRFIESEDRRQATLLPDSLEDYVTDDNPVRVIDVFIDELDLAAMGFAGVAPEATGRPAYHPATLLKIYLYGYLNRIQSSRRLERETQRNIELMWLTGRLMPDFKTIADFRRDNGPAIHAACAQFVVLCRQLNLFTRSVVAVDGSKFKAVLAQRDRLDQDAFGIHDIKGIDGLHCGGAGPDGFEVLRDSPVRARAKELRGHDAARRVGRLGQQVLQFAAGLGRKQRQQRRRYVPVDRAENFGAPVGGHPREQGDRFRGWNGLDQRRPIFQAGLVENGDGGLEIHAGEKGSSRFGGHFVQRFDRVGGMQRGEVDGLGGLDEGHAVSLGEGWRGRCKF